MKKQLLLFLLLCITGVAFAQWKQTNCLLGPVRDFTVAGTRMYISTSKGLFVTENSGQTWQTVRSGIDANRIAVQGQNIVTVRNSSIWRSKDNGLSWENISGNFHPHQVNNIIHTVFFHDQRLFIGLGYDDPMYHSDDFGDSWVEVTNGFTHFDWGYHSHYCSAMDSDYMYVGTSGGVYRALNWNGDCWQEYSGGLPRNMEVYPVGVMTILSFGGKLYAGTGNNDGIYVSGNHSEWWDYAALSGYSIYDLTTDGTRIYAALNSDGLYVSDDTTKTWQSYGMTNAQPYRVESMAPAIFMNTWYSGFLVSRDKGATWNPPNTLTTGEVTSVFDYKGKILAGTLNREIFGSSDFGYTWDKGTQQGIYGTGTGDPVRQIINFHDTLYASSAGSGVFCSYDGGMTWNNYAWGLPTGQSSDYMPVWVLASTRDTIFAGTEGGLYESGRHSNYWNETGYIGKVFSFASEAGALYVGGDAGVYISYDKGNFWTSYGLNQDSIMSLAWSQGNLVAGTNKGIFRLNKVSHTWVDMGGRTVAGMIRKMIPFNTGLIISLNDTMLMMTKNSGTSWTNVSPESHDTINDIYIAGDFIFAATNGEGVWFRDLNEFAGVEENAPKDAFSISPNPAKDKILIRFMVQGTGIADIDVMSATGKTCLSRTIQLSGKEHQATELDCSGLSPGLYLVRIKTNENIQTKKVVIL